MNLHQEIRLVINSLPVLQRSLFYSLGSTTLVTDLRCTRSAPVRHELVSASLVCSHLTSPAYVRRWTSHHQPWYYRCIEIFKGYFGASLESGRHIGLDTFLPPGCRR